MWKVYLIFFIIMIVLGLLWANGIISMHEKNPNYKADDFFNEEENLKQQEK